MNVFQIMDYLTSIEKRYEVQDWTVNDIHIWPSLKIHIYYKIFEHFDKNFSFPSLSLSPFQKIKELLNVLLSLIHSTTYKKKKHYDVLILDNGTSYDFLDNKWFGKFTDTITEKLNTENTSSLTLSKNKSFLFPRHFQYFHILFQLKLRLIKNKIIPVSQNIRADDILNLQNELEAKFPNINWDIISLSKSNALITEVFSNYYKKILHRFTPDKCYVVTYYSISNAGFCKACWDLSIPLHEIQHGVQGYGHAAYARWNNVPKNGFNTLPQFFACWQQTDVDVIHEWAQNTPHKAYVLGNLYLEKLHAKKTKSHLKFENLFQSITTPNKKNHLITLQTGMGLPQNIIDILKKCPNDFFWIRMHPTNICDMPKIIKKLNEERIYNYNIEESSLTPLYIIMPFMNTHITMNSSTVIEAAYFDIPSWILDETGALYYKEYILHGNAFYETDINAGIHNLRRLHHIN